MTASLAGATTGYPGVRWKTHSRESGLHGYDQGLHQGYKLANGDFAINEYVDEATAQTLVEALNRSFRRPSLALWPLVVGSSKSWAVCSPKRYRTRGSSRSTT